MDCPRIALSALAATLFVSATWGLAQTPQRPAGPATRKAAGSTMPRTPWGDPDLQGLWDYSSLTPLQRSEELRDRSTLTDEEAARFVEQERSRADRDRIRPGVVGDFNEFWVEKGTQMTGDHRTSLIVDPPDGRLPPLTAEASSRRAALAIARRGLSLDEPAPGGWLDELEPRVRCLQGVNSGPPMTPSAYNNHVRIVQSPGYAVLLNEQIHDVRVVPLDGRPHGRIRLWGGDSRGRWEGDTLVIDTINFRFSSIGGRAADPGAPLHLVERFTRSDTGTLLYRFTVDDPNEWIRPWTAEIFMKTSQNQMYEFACHEGNYAIAHILMAARARDAAQESGKVQK